MPRTWTDEERAAYSVAQRERYIAKKRESELAEARAKLADAPEEDVPVMPPIVHDEAASAVAYVEPVGEAPVERIEQSDDDFERYLDTLDDEIREYVGIDELRLIHNKRKDVARDEKKAAARKRAEARADRHAKAGAGLIGPEALAAAALREDMARKVRWTPIMPEAGKSGILVDAGLRIDGVLLVHGEEIVTTKAQYISCRAILAAAHQNEQDFQGVGKLSSLRQQAPGLLNMKGYSV